MRERERKPFQAFDSLFPTQALPRQVLRIPLARSQLFAGTSSTPTRKYEVYTDLFILAKDCLKIQIFMRQNTLKGIIFPNQSWHLIQMKRTIKVKEFVPKHKMETLNTNK
jgi:hypothetical protein